ncbi:anthranilate phosphoribosyltransferase [Candidatus Tremblaya phenacola]|uniref:anthranilate phosphoribosyltransferase n=1 Tax=Candidatus Tremblayella phenacoccinincola TaxID=1010676 RepID=UPI0010DF4C41|nr:anthranilate phosphoribosyltransferase [Candidatus Tremblaya phenacola]KAH0998226.1 Anthranilate phosphoribosyltransferase [Candidatus Tremblaya phenacola]
MENNIQSFIYYRAISYYRTMNFFKTKCFYGFYANELLLLFFNIKARGEYLNEVLGIIISLLANSIYFPRPYSLFSDIVGTGGDAANSLNISTISSIVASGCRVSIIKHGNRSNYSFGSSDLISFFNINLNIAPVHSRIIFDKTNYCFLLAVKYHITLKLLIKLRNRIKVNTVFNIVGPLINPSMPSLIIVGIYDCYLFAFIAKLITIFSYSYAIAICGGGLDELVLHFPTKVIEVKNKLKDNYLLTSLDFKLDIQYVEDIYNISNINRLYSLNRLLKGKGNRQRIIYIASNASLLFKVFSSRTILKTISSSLKEMFSSKSYAKVISLAKIK